MFSLVDMKDTIRIPPWKFHKLLKDAVADELRLKFANKVVMNVGLCIALFEITNLDESYIFPGDGASHTSVHFSYIVFRPFASEVLVGKIRSCSREGVHVSLGFFDDILIPQDALQHPSRFDEKEQLWVWVFSNEESGESHDLFMDRDEPIRFRVLDGTFTDTTPTIPESEAHDVDEKDRKIPYCITMLLHLLVFNHNKDNAKFNNSVVSTFKIDIHVAVGNENVFLSGTSSSVALNGKKI